MISNEVTIETFYSLKFFKRLLVCVIFIVFKMNFKGPPAQSCRREYWSGSTM